MNTQLTKEGEVNDNDAEQAVQTTEVENNGNNDDGNTNNNNPLPKNDANTNKKDINQETKDEEEDNNNTNNNTNNEKNNNKKRKKEKNNNNNNNNNSHINNNINHDNNNNNHNNNNNNAQKTNNFPSIFVILLGIIIAFVFFKIFKTFFNQKNQIECPPKYIYISNRDSLKFNINASESKQYNYFWDIHNINNIPITYDNEYTSMLELSQYNKYNGILNITLNITSSQKKKKNKDMKQKKEKQKKEKTLIKQCNIIAKFYDNFIVGIDFGTTYTCASFQTSDLIDNKRKSTMVNLNSLNNNNNNDNNGNILKKCVPTAIYFPKNENESIIIGESALKYLDIDPENVVMHWKRIMGIHAKDEEIKYFKEQHLFDITAGRNPKIIIPNREKPITTEQLTAAIILYVIDSVSKEYFNIDINDNNNDNNNYPIIKDIVLSMPSFFHSGQKNSLKNACKIAKINLKHLMVEPSAAGIAYAYNELYQNLDQQSLFSIFDWGGGTLDISILLCLGVRCEVKAQSGNLTLGGIDFDNIIYQIIKKKFDDNYYLKYTNKEIKQIYKEIKLKSEAIKINLSQYEQSTIHLLSNTNNPLSIKITRKEFEENQETINIIHRSINLLENALKESNQYLSNSNIEQIILVGGTSKIPIIINTFKKHFGNSKIKIPQSIDAQLMVVEGNSIIGGALAYDKYYIGKHNANANDNVQTLVMGGIEINDRTPLSLGYHICIGEYLVNHKCGLMDIVIPKNTIYPVTKVKEYCALNPDATYATLELYEGENVDNIYENYQISNLRIDNIKPRTTQKCNTESIFLVEFNIDSNGIGSIYVNVTGNNYSISTTVEVINKEMNDLEANIFSQEIIQWFDGYPKIQEILN